MPLRSAPQTVKREISDLGLACGVLREPFAWWVMLIGLAGSLLVFSAIGFLGWWLFGQVEWLRQGWSAESRWDNWLLGGLGSVLMVAIVWLTFPLILTAVTGAFLEPLADRIERRHYPFAPAPRHVPLREQIHSSLRVLLRGIGWNLLALPFYFVPVLNVLVYAALNSFLLSREYFQVVAVRHISLNEAKDLYRAHRKAMLRGGLTLALLFVIPGVNLCAPLLATAWMVHRVWRRENSALRRHFLKDTVAADGV